MPTNLNIKMKLVAVGRYKLPKQTQEKVEELNNNHRTLGERELPNIYTAVETRPR